MYVRSGSVYSFNGSWNQSKSRIMRTSNSAASLVDKNEIASQSKDQNFRNLESPTDDLPVQLRDKPQSLGSIPLLE